MDFLKTKNVCVVKDTNKEVTFYNSQYGRKYFQLMYLIRDLYLEYIKNSYNSIIKMTTQLNNGQRIWIHIFPKKIHDD